MGLSSQRSQVVDLGDLVVEGLLEVAIRVNVLLDLSDALNALHITSNVLVVFIELALSQKLDEITHLKHVEVEVSEARANDVFLFA